MNEREAFESVTESYYEGEFSKYADGEYVSQQQQDDFTMFKSGWQACEAQHKQKVRECKLAVLNIWHQAQDTEFDMGFETFRAICLKEINKHFGE